MNEDRRCGITYLPRDLQKAMLFDIQSADLFFPPLKSERLQEDSRQSWCLENYRCNFRGFAFLIKIFLKRYARLCHALNAQKRNVINGSDLETINLAWRKKNSTRQNTLQRWISLREVEITRVGIRREIIIWRADACERCRSISKMGSISLSLVFSYRHSGLSSFLANIFPSVYLRSSRETVPVI